MAHISACLSTPVHVLPRSITSPCTHCQGLCRGRGRGPSHRSSDQRATCLTSSKPLHTADSERIPNLAWVTLCVSAALHACYKLSRVWPGDEHRQHMWCTRWWGRCWNTWITIIHDLLLMHELNILCLTRTCSEWCCGNHLLNVHFFLAFIKKKNYRRGEIRPKLQQFRKSIWGLVA